MQIEHVFHDIHVNLPLVWKQFDFLNVHQSHMKVTLYIHYCLLCQSKDITYNYIFWTEFLSQFMMIEFTEWLKYEIAPTWHSHYISSA